jgi:hypothetical protein
MAPGLASDGDVFSAPATTLSGLGVIWRPIIAGANDAAKSLKKIA